VLTAWLDSGTPLILGLLALSGLVHVARSTEWPRAVKAPFYLCAWLVLAISIELGQAHPTFSQYFLLTVPFLAILSAVGLYAISSTPKFGTLICVLFALGLGRALYDDNQNTDWSAYQRIADKIEHVTAPGALLFADEPI